MEFGAFLIDIDGVLHVGQEPIEGAVAAIALLRERGIGFRLITNTTSRSRRRVVERLTGLGFDVDERDVLTPAALAVRHCRDAGHEHVALHVADALAEDFTELSDTSENPEAVILGDLGTGFTYARMNAIFNQLEAGAELIALQRNRVWQTEDGLVLDAGPFVVALEYATGRDAIVTGKPSAAFFEAALAELGVDAASAAMIGDDLEADVGGALDAGLSGILVRTGKFRPQVLADSDIEPTLVLDSIAELPDLLPH
ncbi:MAG TPA: TIGR01458 family HAD-type hydrolase [Baekduia sp.]|nr:TIGR01458 family HAD-type hydrolase [Baekduia sp.]